jgi:hypothetical protein
VFRCLGARLIRPEEYEAINDRFGIRINSEHFFGNEIQQIGNSFHSLPFRSVDCTYNIQLFQEVREFVCELIANRQ